ncbi:GspH/FimT family pseudopilin [Halomonas sp. BC04]|uniref:GspH/FimT family pseudopilin n=1 Tax=Halomonas sp. BC04 TaxID=1403540 RepID=UPI0005BC410A|nr:GspH/FimT family pseudopilin [Halomonas sp. BC04]
MMKARGFTLIELLVTIAVMAIMATIAVPGFQNMMASNRLAGDYNEVLSGLNYARSEAIKRRENVTFQIDDGSGTWVYEVKAGGIDLVIRQGRDSRVVVSDVTVVFNSLGRRESCSSTACEISVSNSSGSREMQVSTTGRIGKSP